MDVDVPALITVAFFFQLAIVVTIALVAGPPETWTRNSPSANTTKEEDSV